MPILNYTTSIKSEKTLMEIQECLVKHGITKIVLDYEDALPCAVTFSMLVKDTYLAYSLPANYKGVLQAMTKKPKVPRKLVNDAQALRVSWRIVKDWVEAQMAMIEAELATLPEIFLPYLITKNGQTLYKQLEADNFKLLN